MKALKASLSSFRKRHYAQPDDHPPPLDEYNETIENSARSSNVLDSGGSVNNFLESDIWCSRCKVLNLETIFDTSPLPTEDEQAAPARILDIGPLTDEDQNSPCPVCRFFACSRFDWIDRAVEYFYLWKIPWNYGYCMSSEAAPSRLRDQTVLVVTKATSASQLNVIAASRLENKGFLMLADSASQGSGLFLRRRSDRVNFELLRSWISNCIDYHDCCVRDGNIKPSLVPVEVIDCDSSDIRLASRDTKYAALSYVWGTELNSEGIEISFDGTKRLPLNLPLLIRDAIHATKALGLDYLWVDRYCIANSDHNLRHEQIKRMDQIYGNAELTLVALVTDPSCGLPGVDTCARTIQPSLCVGEREILGSLRPPKLSIRESKWYTRASTMQETILSRRRLYFTLEQTYFECRLAHHCETIDWKPTLDDIQNGFHGPWGELVLSLELDLQIYTLHRHLDNYLRRDMTYESDAINAFQGILQQYAYGQKSIQNYFGLPFETFTESRSRGLPFEMFTQLPTIMESFTNALTWMLYNAPVVQRLAVTRRPQFPSWSWAGWRGSFQAFQSMPIHIWFVTTCIERLDGEVRSPEAFLKEGGFDLPVTRLGNFIWVEGPSAWLRLDFASESKGHGRQRMLPVVILWEDNDTDKQCYLETHSAWLPLNQEMSFYSELIVFRVSKPKERNKTEHGNYVVLLATGVRNGQRERVACFRINTIDLQIRSLPKEKEFRTKYKLPESTDLGSWNRIKWDWRKLRIG